MVTIFRPISRPIWRAATYLSSMAGSSRSPITRAISPPSISIPAAIARSTSCSPIRATSRPHACMNHWASPRSIRPSASLSRSTSAAKPACPASTPPATSPRPSCPRSPRHHRRARWRVSSPSNRCWSESTDFLLRLPGAVAGKAIRRGGDPQDLPLIRCVRGGSCPKRIKPTSSRKIERKTHEDVAFRVIAGGGHPDHSRISDFRRVHLGALAGLFVEILRLCQKAGLVKLGSVALDGTKVKANASKHKAMSYERMKKDEQRLREKVSELL